MKVRMQTYIPKEKEKHNMILLFLFFILHQSLSKQVDSEKKSIIEEPSCGEVNTICHSLSENDDLLILECLHSINPNKLSDLNEGCQNTIWEHTRNLIQDEKVKEILMPICRNDLNTLNCKIGDESYLKCIVNSKDALQSPDCSQMVSRLENVAFTDYRFISSFLQHCTDDIKNLQCGRFDAHSLSQFKTITCLQSSILKVKDECKREVFRLSELQSDNIKLDGQLYLDCAEDHSRYCSQFPAGSGRVFNCLMRQDPKILNAKCKQHLLRRQKLMVQDYRVSKGLMRACKDDIKKTHCRRQTSNDKTVRLAQILLCLENMMKNGTKLESDCEAEMMEHRRMLMEDYRLSPEIVDNCKGEIASFCKGFEVGGKTIHCLMSHAMEKAGSNKARIDPKCQRALESLIEQSDAGENWRVDPILHKACYPVVKAVCNDLKGGDGRVMSCLMDNIGTDHMNEECEDALIQIQYFVARDFKLDPQLYGACKEDAANLCHNDMEWHNEEGPSYAPQVLPCLYRYIEQPPKAIQLGKTCQQQIRRVMRQRAISVDLQPEIEEYCLQDLGVFCHDKVRKGEEMLCLQKNLEELDDKCHDRVEMFTEIEAEHAELNPYVNKYCRKIIDTLCNTESKNDEGDIMECLISHKNDPLVKAKHECRASIEHFQIISVKDYKFSYKFKVACKAYAMRFCSQVRTKNEVVHCLSEHVLNATVHGVKSDIPKDCKQQLKAQLFQQRENIDYDPSLKAACHTDIDKHCSHIVHGNAQVLECLQTVIDKLSDKCEKEVFKVKKQEVYDNTVDYALITTCADAIDQFCAHHDKETVLDCLKDNKNEKGFNKKCRLIVMHRMVEQNSNYQLNPLLQQSCKMDIDKFCKKFLQPHIEDTNGHVIKCLREQFKLSKLSNKCEIEMAGILKEQALNVNLNPLISVVCKNELSTICKSVEDDSGDTEECLKNALLNNHIQTPECKVEVANMIEESQADIQVDPLLQRACALDLLNFCTDVPQGNGRRIRCLKVITDKFPQKLSANCRNLLKKRLEMYRNAAQFAPVPPADLLQLSQLVGASPAKHYFFLMIMMIVGTIFFVGIFCGRVTKNKYTLLKNK